MPKKKTTRTKAAKKSKSVKKSAAAKKVAARTQFLFVQLASDAELVPLRGPSTYTLNLRGLERTIYFSDRPARLTGHESTKEFVDNWSKGKDSFAKDAPNAELVIYMRDKAPAAVTVILSNPKWTPDAPDTISYTAKISSKGRLPSNSAGSAALFIDDWGGWSDRRIKQDVAHLTTLENGIKLYSFKYLEDDEIHVGVMAQDLLSQAAFKHAVKVMPNGYYAVNYAALGLRMATLDEWEESGISAVMLGFELAESAV